MISALNDVVGASLPLRFLGALAEVRDIRGTRVALIGNCAFVRWEMDDERILRAILPVPGVTLYCQRDGQWYRHGSHLPDFDFPEIADYRPLPEVLTPAVVKPLLPHPVARKPVALRLVPDARGRPASAMRCSVTDLARWADTVPSMRLQVNRAAYKDGQVLLLSSRLPPLLQGERFYGSGVLVPLGYGLEPDLPATAVREALGIDHHELLLIRQSSIELIALDDFQPLTRRALKLIGQKLDTKEGY